MAQKERNSFVQYFRNVWSGIATTLVGMKLTLRYFFKPKVTLQYPEEKPLIPEGHRGLHRYDEDRCNLCRACEAACPVDCILINALGRGKDRLILDYTIDYSKCLFCNLCCEACVPKCISMGPQYDLASSQRAGCLVQFARKKDEVEIKEHQAMLERKEAERKAAQEKAAQDKASDKALAQQKKEES